MREIDPEAKAIVTSGYANATVMTNYKDYEFQGRLPKPFTAIELSEVLEGVLYRREA